MIHLLHHAFSLWLTFVSFQASVVSAACSPIRKKILEAHGKRSAARQKIGSERFATGSKCNAINSEMIASVFPPFDAGDKPAS
jgi:hypothetical protein